MIRFTWISETRLRVSPVWCWTKRWVYGVFNRIMSNFLPLVLIILTAAILGVIGCNREWIINDSWTWLGALSDNQESKSTTLRNLGLLVGAAIAIGLAVWRSKIAERQADAAQRQAEITQSQVEIAQSQIEIARSQAQTAQQSLLNERYQTATDMIGSSILAVRLGGIYALQGLAEQNPEQYHVPVMQLLCSFVRHPTEVEGQPVVALEEFSVTREQILSICPDRKDLPPIITSKRFKPREDIQAAMKAIALCHDRNQKAETDNSYWLDLHGADLRGVDLSEMNLARAPWSIKPIDSSYHLRTVGMYTDMQGTKLEDASFLSTILSSVDFTGATGLTQSKLDMAKADTDNPPKLDGVLDAETGKQLVWCGAATNPSPQ